jgi:membrane-bound lytic murein transglycosylase D
LVSVGAFTPEPYEICRPSTEIYSFEEVGFCLKDEVVMPSDDYDVIPVSHDLASYIQNQRAIRAVERNIEIYTVDLRETFARYLSRSGKYLRMMKNILREEGIPEDMAYLALVESGFNTRAYSRRRAAGPWQFISATGRRYGLKVDWWVDERRDPVKSTKAAARYLKDLYDMFGSWSLAMAAYNAGEGKVRRALSRTRSHDYWGLLSTRHIKRETKNYVPSFIAAKLIATNPEEYGFHDIKYEEDFVFDEVELESPLTLDIVAKCAETKVEKIKELNPELRRWSTPPHVQNYRVRIPRGMREQFLSNLSKIPEGKRFTVHVYRVKRGDTVSQIAQKTGVPQRVIISYNKLNRRGFITVGQKLLLPVGLAAN